MPIWRPAKPTDDKAVDLSQSKFAYTVTQAVPEPCLPLVISLFFDGTPLDKLYVAAACSW
jgi:hypothetical protein